LKSLMLPLARPLDVADYRIAPRLMCRMAAVVMSPSREGEVSMVQGCTSVGRGE